MFVGNLVGLVGLKCRRMFASSVSPLLLLKPNKGAKHGKIASIETFGLPFQDEFKEMSKNRKINVSSPLTGHTSSGLDVSQWQRAAPAVTVRAAPPANPSLVFLGLSRMSGVRPRKKPT